MLTVMDRAATLKFFLRSTALSALLIACAHAAGSDDAERARRAVERGEYAPLQGLIDDALERHPGRLVSVELDDAEYEIEILRDDGLVVELEYDARTGKLLESEIGDD